MKITLNLFELVAWGSFNLFQSLNGVNLVAFVFSLIAGGVVGVLINYFSDVLPISRRISRPLCSVCSQPYSISDYLVSFKCSKCGSKKSIRSNIVFIGAILICILLNFFPFYTLGFWATLPILIFLGVIMVIDIEHHIVLFETSLFGMGLFLIYGILLTGLPSTLLGALAGFLIMLAFFILGLVFSKIMGYLRHQQINEVAFGFGDVLAGTFLGLLAGWPAIAGAIFIAILTFGAYSFVLLSWLLLSKRYKAFSSAQPFIPFLIIGVITIFYL